MELVVIYLFFSINLNLLLISLLEPDPHFECGSRRENECGSGSTALKITRKRIKASMLPKVKKVTYIKKLILFKNPELLTVEKALKNVKYVNCLHSL